MYTSQSEPDIKLLADSVILLRLSEPTYLVSLVSIVNYSWQSFERTLSQRDKTLTIRKIRPSDATVNNYTLKVFKGKSLHLDMQAWPFAEV